MPSPSALPTLLLSLFSESELRRFVRWGPNGRELEARLPARGVPPADLASAVAELYEREGLIAELPKLLLEERPRRADDIRVVFEQIAGQQLAAAKAPPGTLTPINAAPEVSGTRPRSVTGMPWDLFLVHSAQDKVGVHAIFDVVAPNVRTFLDDRLPPGTQWDATIKRALEESAVIGVLASKKTWADSFYLRAEVQSAIGLMRGTHDWIRVVPLHLDGMPAAADHIYGLNLLQGITVSEKLPLAAAARQLEQVVLSVRPLHRLASLLQRLFPAPDELARWVATVPLVDPIVDRPVRIDPTHAPPTPWRQAARQLHATTRTDPADPVLFDMLRAHDPAQSSLVDQVQQAFAEAPSR